MLCREILRTRKVDGVLYINNSGADLINTCGRKASYVFAKPEQDITSLAANFGRSIHVGLQCFYQADRRDDNLLEEMIAAFKAAATPDILAIDNKEKRSIGNGEKILKQFFDTYREDVYEIYKDDVGPFVERQFEVDLFPGVRFFGTIDAILRNKETGELVVCDHKTTSTLGAGFPNKADVSHQLTGYVFACQAMGIQVTRVMFQGLQVAKTMCQVLRVPAVITDDKIQEWKEWMQHTVTVWEMMSATKNYPMNGSQACTIYSGCHYLPVCSAPIRMRESIMAEITNTGDEE